MQIQHFSHPYHNLTLLESSEILNEFPNCNCCNEVIFLPAYTCESVHCMFYLHKSCAELAPKISHPLHPQHPLTLLAKISGSGDYGVICNGCRNLYRHGFTYRCTASTSCDFNLDPKCASTQAEHQQASKELTPFFFWHQHVLQLCNLREPFKTNCCCCKKSISGSAYCCLKCDLFIHESCKKIPLKVDHPFHPQHKLVSQAMGKDESRTCNACQQSIRGISIGCKKCNFNLHVSCTNRQTSFSLKQKCHQHNMYYFVDEEQMGFRCHNCNNFLKNSFYRCVECDVNLDFQCIPIPTSIKHNEHIHPIILTNSILEDDSLKHYLTHLINEDDDDLVEYYCDVCETPGNPKHHAYCCKECLYVAHVECIISEVSQTSKEKGRKVTIHHFFHEHELELNFFMEDSKGSNRNPSCCWCYKEISGPGYRCIDCKFFIHDFCCMEISPQLQHPLHPHPLHPKQNFAPYGTKKCRACRKLIFENMFLCCEECNFDLHILCAKEIKPFLERKFHNHNHNHNLRPMGGCWYCYKCCHWHYIPNFYQCMECDANTRFGCIPIPKGVKHKCHRHSFFLMYLTEADSSEYHSKVCEICKTQWTAPELVYSCEKCTRFVHVACMVSENDTSLETHTDNEEDGDIEVNTQKIDDEVYGLAESDGRLVQDEHNMTKDVEYENKTEKYYDAKDEKLKDTSDESDDKENESDEVLGQKINKEDQSRPNNIGSSWQKLHMKPYFIVIVYLSLFVLSFILFRRKKAIYRELSCSCSTKESL